MRDVWNNYRSTILMLIGVVIGGVLGFVLPESVPYLSPVGDIFMNILFVMIVPMVFFSVSSSVCNLTSQSALGKTLGAMVGTMVGLMLLMAGLAYALMAVFPPVSEGLMAGDLVSTAESKDVGNLIVDAFTVKDFAMLFSVKHVLPLMVVAIIFGCAVALTHQEKVAHALEKTNGIVVKMMDIVMKAAPVGLGCYFAGLMAESGDMLAEGYGKLVLLYLAVAGLVYVLLLPLLVWFSTGRMGLYWKEIIKPSLMAISTLSSSACIPVNIEATKRMGTDNLLAESVVPIGTQVFKLGSVMTCVMKIMFVMLLMGGNIYSMEAFAVIIGVALLASMVMGAVPTGAGTAELFICSIIGADPSMVGLLMVFSTIVDMPATLVNVSGNTVLPAVVNRITRQAK